MPQGALRRLASIISTLGHPAVVMILAVAFAPGSPNDHVTGIATWVVPLLIIAIGLGFAIWKVRRGQWRHVDASLPTERAQLNAFMLPVLAAASLECWFWLGQHALALGLAASSLILGSALLLSRWLKLSLHVGFAMLSACVLVAGPALLMIAITALVAITWSRLHLKRHTWPDLLAGGGIGLIAGISWRLLTS